MANYQGNPEGGVKLSDHLHKIAASPFQILTRGMGLDALLSGGTGGNVPLLSSAGTNPVLSGLAFAGTENPLATLMGRAGGDPAALLTSLIARNAGAEMDASSALDPQAKIYEAAVEALQDPKFAELFVRSYPSALQNIVKLLTTMGAGGGGAVG